METHTIKNVLIKVDEKLVAKLPEATANLSVNRIEVTVGEVLLTKDTAGLLELANSTQEFDVSGVVNDKTLVVMKSKVNHLIFDAKQGEAVVLRDISILGLHAEWLLERR